MTKKVVDTEAKTVTFTFDDGNVETFDLSKVSEAMLIQLALHGASQKGGDSYAGAKAATADSDIDPAEWSWEQVRTVIKQLYNDEWTVRTPGSGGAVTDLANALAEVVGCPIEDAVAKLADSDADQKKALRAHPQIKAVLERIKLERQKAKAAKAAAAGDSGPDLSEFMNG